MRSLPLRMGLAALSGVAAAAAFPPFGIIGGLAGFGVLLALLNPASPLSRSDAFLVGWTCGCAYFLVSTWWVAEAFLVDRDAHGWQAPFAVVFLAGGLGLLWGLGAVAFNLISPNGPARLVVFAGVWSAVEWTRGHVLTGFPWDLPGEAWRAGDAPSQLASVVGAYGLSYLTLLAAGALALVAAPASPGDRRVGVGVLAAFALACLWGEARLKGPHPAARDLVVRVVQPNIPQTEKWSPEALQSVIERYAALSRGSSARRPDVVVWPESALPAPIETLLEPGTWTRPLVTGAIADGQVLLAGVIRVENRGGRYAYFNSLMALRREGDELQALARYDKHHLVPFGEYTPFDGLAAAVGFKALVHLGEGYEAGPPAEALDVQGLGRLQPLICYESLFPGSFGRRGRRSDWIVNVSNDAWFGDTSGPWQHLNLASYRAIEEGAPVVRSTPTGVSAIVDAFGRPLSWLPIGVKGVIDARLPGPLPRPTPYQLWGEGPFGLAVVASLATGVVLRRRRAGDGVRRQTPL